MCNVVTSDDCHRFGIYWCAYITLSSKAMVVSWWWCVSFMSQFALHFPSFPLQFNQNELTQVEWGTKKSSLKFRMGFYSTFNIQYQYQPQPRYSNAFSHSFFFCLVSFNVRVLFFNFFFQFLSFGPIVGHCYCVIDWLRVCMIRSN